MATKEALRKAREYDKRVFVSQVDREFYRNYVRPRVLARDGNKCVKCGSKENLDVNHKHYDLERLTIDGFETLCRSCHKKFHKRESVDWRK